MIKVVNFCKVLGTPYIFKLFGLYNPKFYVGFPAFLKVDISEYIFRNIQINLRL